jgi:hypothetical protein
MSLDLQAFEHEEGIESSKNVIVPGYKPTHRRFAQGGILFERFMEDFYWPSFLIGC